MTDISIVCGPHAHKRHGSDFATVARASVSRTPDVPTPLITFFGVVEQRAYRGTDSGEEWDEYVGPLFPDLATPFERRRFDGRWQDAQEPLNTVYGSEVAVRERSVLRCPVCAQSMPIGDADELRSVLGKIASAGVESVSLDGLRRARNMNKIG